MAKVSWPSSSKGPAAWPTGASPCSLSRGASFCPLDSWYFIYLLWHSLSLLLQWPWRSFLILIIFVFHFKIELSQVLSVSSFKMGHFCDMFNWRMTEGYAYWPLWARQAGSMLQLIPILLIPAVGLIQCIRYLSSGPSDLFDVRWWNKTKRRFTRFHLWLCFFESISRGSNYFTGQTSERTSSRASRLPALHPGRRAVSRGASGADRVVPHDPVRARRRLIRQRFPIRRPNTLRLRPTTRPLERGNPPPNNIFNWSNFKNFIWFDCLQDCQNVAREHPAQFPPDPRHDDPRPHSWQHGDEHGRHGRNGFGKRSPPPDVHHFGFQALASSLHFRHPGNAQPRIGKSPAGHSQRPSLPVGGLRKYRSLDVRQQQRLFQHDRLHWWNDQFQQLRHDQQQRPHDGGRADPPLARILPPQRSQQFALHPQEHGQASRRHGAVRHRWRRHDRHGPRRRPSFGQWGRPHPPRPVPVQCRRHFTQRHWQSLGKYRLSSRSFSFPALYTLDFLSGLSFPSVPICFYHRTIPRNSCL